MNPPCKHYAKSPYTAHVLDGLPPGTYTQLPANHIHQLERLCIPRPIHLILVEAQKKTILIDSFFYNGSRSNPKYSCSLLLCFPFFVQIPHKAHRIVPHTPPMSLSRIGSRGLVSLPNRKNE